MTGPNFQAPTCTEPGCDGLASRTSGMCRRHTINARNRRLQATSDGHKTGNRLKLSDADVVEARRMYAALRTRREIAAHFGVSLPVLRRALAGEDR